MGNGKKDISDKKKARLLARLGIEPKPEVDPAVEARQRAEAEFEMMGKVLGFYDSSRAMYGGSAWLRASKVAEKLGADSGLVLSVHAILADRGALAHVSGEKYQITPSFDDVFIAHMEAQDAKAAKQARAVQSAGYANGNGNRGQAYLRPV